MDEKQKNKIVDEQQENTVEEVKDEQVVAEEQVEQKEEVVEEEKVEGDETTEQPTVDDVPETDKVEDDKVDEEQKDEVVVDEPEEEQKTEDEVKEEERDIQPEEEKVDEEIDELSKVKAELEEIKAIRAEEENIKEFERQAMNDDLQMDNVCKQIQSDLTQAFKNMGIDPEKSLDELKKEDPEKAFNAKQLIESAMRLRDTIAARQQENRDNKLREIVFKRAARLFDKFNLTDEEGNVAAETFIDILGEVGLKNLDDDLKAKVELAVGKTKLLAPKVEKVTEEIVDIAKDVKEIVNDVLAPAPEVNPDEEKVVEEINNKEEVVEEKVEEEKVEEPKIDVAAFEESVGVNTPVMTPGELNDPLGELAKIRDSKERVLFYKEHAKEIEAAMKKKTTDDARKRML